MDRIIKVTGKGKISVKPDTIRLNIEAEGLYKEYEKTVQKSTEATCILRETIEKAGLKAEDLKTVHFDIDSEYERYRDKNDDYRSRFVDTSTLTACTSNFQTIISCSEGCYMSLHIAT